MNTSYTIRLFQPTDAQETSNMIADTLRIINSKDYPPEIIEKLIDKMPPEMLCRRANEGHMYVVLDGAVIIGVGCIAGFWGSTTESILLTIFVHHAYQGQGIGRHIVETLEQDEYFLRAKRIEVAASITAVEFYRKFGYDYKNGIRMLEDESFYRLDKHRTPIQTV